MELFTQALCKMYEQDPKHSIKDPMEHILNDMGITPRRKKDSHEIEEPRIDPIAQLKEENEELKRDITNLENTLDQLQQELQSIQRQRKMQKSKAAKSAYSDSVSAGVITPKPDSVH